MADFFPLPAPPPEDALRFTIASTKRCPLYTEDDEFELEGLGLTSASGKAACVVLAADILRAVGQRREARDTAGASPLSFTCSGCSGTVTVSGLPLASLFGDLNDMQRRRVEALVETLGRFSLFKALSEKELRKVLPEMQAGDFRPGAVIVRQGELGTNLFIVESGSVDVLAGKNDEILLTTLRQGEIFGEMSLLSGARCSATIRVAEPSRLLAISGGAFTRMVVRYPSLQRYLFRLLTHRLRETNALKETRLSKGIGGHLDDLQLAELLQALHMSGKSGVLSLNLPRGSATVALRKGELVGVEYLGVKDSEGFFELLKETEGTFTFAPVLPPEYAGNRSIGGFMALLMEGLVRIDENTHR